MDGPAALWRSKTDEEVLEAALVLEEYTEEAEGIIRAELRRRGLQEPEPAIGHCQRCARSIHRNDKSGECSQCGEPYPATILSAIAAQPSADSPEKKGQLKKYTLAVLACGAEFLAYAFIGVLLGWKHGGGYVPMVILFSVVGWTWRAITRSSGPQASSRPDDRLEHDA